MKLDKHVIDMFTELTKPADNVKMEKTCYGTISVVDGTRYVKLDGSDLLVPAASTVKTSHGDRVTVLMKNHSLTVTGNLTAPATDGEGGSSGEAGTAATIEVGTVTTGEAGSSASVTNSGTASAAVFDFVIPRGDKGEKGDTGPQGPQGEKGDTGTWDGTIPDHQHRVSDILNFPTSLPARGGNADTVDELHAASFLQNLGFWSTGSIKDLILSSSTSGTVFIDNTVSGMPVDNAYWFGFIDRKITNIIARVVSINNKARYSITYNGSLQTWYGWVNETDGGNADTLDGLHASDFPRMMSDIADCNSAMEYGTYNIVPETLNAPTANYYHLVVEPAASGAWIKQTAVLCDADASLITPYIRININGTWSGWVRCNDGGNSDTVDGKHAESFMQWLGRQSDTTILNDANYKVDYHCNIADGTLVGLPVANWYHIIYYMHEYQNGHGMQIAYPLNFDGATMIRRATGITWETWRNVADGGNAATASHQIYHILGTGTDILSYAASDICPYYVNTKVRIMHSPTCPTNYGYDAANNDFWYDIYKLDNSWVTIKAYDIRGNVEFINSRLNGTWTGWARCNDYGNADTVDGLHANEIASNPNLLINPDFKINQRGKSVYNGKTYTADCWKCISSNGQVTVGDSGITVTNTAGKECKIQNYVERDLTGKTITLSACIDGTVYKVSGIATTDMTTWSKQLKVYFDDKGYLLFGSHQVSPPLFFVMLTSSAGKSFTCQWVKLELGGIATPFTPTDPATELAKCQRYYQIRSTNYNSVVDLSPSMRIAPTVTQIGSSRYAYSAEF